MTTEDVLFSEELEGILSTSIWYVHGSVDDNRHSNIKSRFLPAWLHIELLVLRSIHNVWRIYQLIVEINTVSSVRSWIFKL